MPIPERPIDHLLPAGIGDHGTLAGLGDDDHAQYPLLAGRSGGQTWIGGTGSGDDITLTSTSHATKGTIIVNDHLQLAPQSSESTASGALYNLGTLLKFYAGFQRHIVLAPNESGLALGDTFYWDGTRAVRVAAGSAGQLYKSAGAAAPTWATFALSDIPNGTVGYVLEAGASAPAYAPRTIRHRREMQFLSNPGLTTGTLVGLATAPTISGTTITNVDSSARPAIRTITGATIGNSAGVLSGFNVTRNGWSSEGNFVLSTGNDLTLCRIWTGFTSVDLNAVATPTIQHVAAFGYDTVLDGTAFWRTATCGGTATTRTATSVAITAGVTYNLRIELLSTTVNFYIDNVLVNAHTTNNPGAGAILGFQMCVTTLTAATRRLDWSRVGIISI